MPKASCKGGGQDIEIPAGIKSGNIFDCPNGAGLSLRASEKDGVWSVTAVKKASCAVGDEPVIFPDDVQPGDIIECHGVKQRVTYEYGAYALVKTGLSGSTGVSWGGSSAGAVPSCPPCVASCRGPSSSSAWAAARLWPPRGSTPPSSSPSASSAGVRASTSTFANGDCAPARGARWPARQ